MTNREGILIKLRYQKHELSKFGISEVGLFASYLGNQQSAQSDIDLLIAFEPEKGTFDNFMAACDLFENIFEDETVEIVTRNGLSPYIGQRILNEVMHV